MMRSVLSRFVGSGGQLARSLSTKTTLAATPLRASLVKAPSALRSLGGVMARHDTHPNKSDDELVSFLGEEIETEKKGQKSGSLPTKLSGFDVKLNHSEIILTKKFNNETVTITLNVNHSVDADFSDEGAQKGEKDAEMRSRPNFEIDIQKGNETLTFGCSYIQGDAMGEETPQEEYQDTFAIEDVCFYEGEWSEQALSVTGDILDGYLYDLLMSTLEERGINTEFADKLSDFCTEYEHKLYIDMLQKLQKFFSTK